MATLPATTPRAGFHRPAPQSEPTEAEQQLAATSDEGLLTAYAALTHQMDQLRTARDRTNIDDRRAAVRAQRDLVSAEVLRRMSTTAELLNEAYATGVEAGVEKGAERTAKAAAAAICGQAVSA